MEVGRPWWQRLGFSSSYSPEARAYAARHAQQAWWDDPEVIKLIATGSADAMPQYPTITAVYGTPDLRNLRNAGYSDAQIEAMAQQELANKGFTGPNAVADLWNATAAQQKANANAYKAFVAASVPGLDAQGTFTSPEAAQQYSQAASMRRPPRFQASVYQNRGGFGHTLTPAAYKGYMNRPAATSPFPQTWYNPLTGQDRPVDPRLSAPYAPGYQAPRGTANFGMADFSRSPVWGSAPWRRSMNLSDIR